MRCCCAYSDVEADQKKMTIKQLLAPKKKIGKSPAEGYPDGATSLYNKVNITEFLKAENHIELLSNASEVCQF